MTQLFPCRVCSRTDFEDWGELADHILKDHKKNPRNKTIMASRKWAAEYKYKHVLYGKKEFQRVALTEEQKEAKADCMMMLSGQTKVVKCQCPKCKSGRFERLPVEHTDNPLAWVVSGYYQVMCLSCGG